MIETTDPTVKIGSSGGRSPREAGRSGALAWIALGVAVAAVLVAVGSALAVGARVDRLRSERNAAADRAAAAEKASHELAASLEGLSARLAEAESRCRKLEAGLPSEAKLRDLSVQAAREELARSHQPAARDAAALAAQAEREKNLPPEQKEQVERLRANILDGVTEWADIQQQVKDGKITPEEARRQVQEKMRQRMEELRKNMPEDQRKAMEERMKAWRERRGGGGAGRAPEPVPAPKEEF